MRAPGSRNASHALSRVLASGRWVHVDGDLVVASEAANPGLRDSLASQAVDVGVGAEFAAQRVRESQIANRESVQEAEDREQLAENPYFPERSDLGEVRRGPRVARVCESPHFAVFALDDAIIVAHRLEPSAIDNDLAELVAGELVRPGHVAIPRAFERCFAGVVLSSAPEPKDAWQAFYDNTLSRLEQVESGTYPGNDLGPVEVFGRIYGYARGLVAGSSLLDVGTCFGFFPLLLQRADPRLDVVALDVSAPMLDLAREAAASRHDAKTARFVCGDALSLPFAGGSFDTVTALHVLEHLDSSSASRALGEMCRVARRRAIVAVPLEEQPDLAYDHLQSFDRRRLLELGEETGWRCNFESYLGGWIVLEPHK